MCSSPRCDLFFFAATEQPLNIKFCIKLRKTARETYKTLEAVYGNDIISCTHVSELSETFGDGCEDHHNVQGVGEHQLLDEICEHLQKLKNWLPETVE